MERGAEVMSELLGERGERFKCCGAQNRQLGFDRSDRSPVPVRPVRVELAQTDRNKFELVICRLSFELITVVNLIISN